MIISDQHIDTKRYGVIPRTLAFILCGEDVLLIRYSALKGKWAGKLNGLGGHIEKGEDPLRAIRRELHEEAQLTVPDLSLCGTVLIDTGSSPGVSLYIFLGHVASRIPPFSSEEGELTWIPLCELDTAPLLEDIRVLLPEAIASASRKACFSAHYAIHSSEDIQISFSPPPSLA
ncbi:MAG: NUDIX domain-containing protein [Anaerolineales bacterium]|nr:NUDIX domain-containing protein [Anaerolineales bacterium]